MPRPGEDRSDVGGATQFNNIGPVPLSPAFSTHRTAKSFSSQSKILLGFSEFYHVVSARAELRRRWAFHPDKSSVAGKMAMSSA